MKAGLRDLFKIGATITFASMLVYGMLWIRAGGLDRVFPQDGSNPNPPVEVGVRVLDEDAVSPGYVLYWSANKPITKLIDIKGKVVHQWNHDGVVFHMVEMAKDGTLYGVTNQKNDETGSRGYFKVDWNGNITLLSDLPTHHDFDRSVPGSTLLLCKIERTGTKLRNGKEIEDDVIVRLDETMRVTWQWRLADHVDELLALTKIEFDADKKDWAHVNSIEVLPPNPLEAVDERFKRGNILLSSLNLSTIFIVDAESNQIVWAIGRPTLDGQHMPTLLPNGNILVFDNGEKRRITKILELNPISKEVVWSHTPEPAFFTLRGSSQRLENGNTIYTDSDGGRIVEITGEGTVVWEYLNPELRYLDFTDNDKEAKKSVRIYRATKHDPAFVEPILKAFQTPI